MRTITVHGKLTTSQILVGEHITNLENYLPHKKIIVITDKNVNRIYRKYFSKFPSIVLEPGEKTKNLQTIETIINKLLVLGADRHTFLVGIGGGVVCDITGFVASVFMRGIDFGFVSTTLLSQIDASIGGKNGVNFQFYKNIIGTIRQPSFVICDINMLTTLPEKEIRSGWGEIIKHALIADSFLFDKITRFNQNIFQFEHDFYLDLVFRNIHIKTSIVNNDEKEYGERKKLNFGHTIGHAIEKLTDLSHGESVVLGILFSVWWSKEQMFLPQSDAMAISKFLNKFNLNQPKELSAEIILDVVKKDKKKYHDSIDFVFLEAIGRASVKRISLMTLSKAIEAYFRDKQTRKMP